MKNFITFLAVLLKSTMTRFHVSASEEDIQQDTTIALPPLQHHIRHRLLAFLSLMLLIMMCACQNQKEEILINANENELSESMKNFISVHSLDYKEGTHFQAKLLKVNQIDSAETNTKYYYYNILVAPKTSSVKKIQSITFKPETEIIDYYDKNKKESLSGLSEWNDIFTKIEYPTIEKMQDYTAYQYDFVFSNLNNNIQNHENISAAELNNYMKNITIEIFYNDNKKEILHLTADEMSCYKNYEETPKNLAPLFDGDSIVTGMNPFEE